MVSQAVSVPVKITDGRWADELRRGSLFMRSLHDFGAWSVSDESRIQEMKDGVQADVCEGVVQRVDPAAGDDLFNAVEPSLRQAMKECFYLDKERIQFLKVFCMYGLTYLDDQKRFEKPDERLAEFGDTAVVIFDPAEFARRVMGALRRDYGDGFAFRASAVAYYPPDYYGPLNEFCKADEYAWQNELRFCVALADGEERRVDELGRTLFPLQASVEPLLLNVGDLTDITVAVPVERLLTLDLPEQVWRVVREAPLSK